MDKTIPQPKLFDPQAGAPLSLPADQISRAVASGKATFMKGDKIPVVTPDGETGEIPAEEAQTHFQQGFQYEPLDSQAARAEKHEYGDGSGNELKAFAAGAARGATLGLSDAAMTGSGLVDPETLAKLDRYNPVASGTGQVAGVIAPALLTGGISAEADGLAGAARGAAEATPASLVSKAGSKITAATRAVLGEAPEGSGLARRILAKAAPAAAGSAVEGAFYGAGNVISDHALGDPDHLAENVLGEVGLGAIIGGTLGSAFGITEGALSRSGVKAAEEAALPGAIGEASQAAEHAPLSEAEQAARYGSGVIPSEPGTLEGSLDEMKLSDEQKKGVMEGLTKLKSNSQEVIDAAKAIDAPVLESQISDSKHVQDLDSMLIQSPTPIGVARQQLAQKGLDAAETAVRRGLGEGSEMSQVDVGNAIKKGLTEKIEQENAPIAALYDELKASHEAIPVSDRSIAAVSRNIMNLREVVQGEGSSAASLAQKAAKRLESVQTVDDLKFQKSLLRQELGLAATPAEKHMAGVIAEKLSNLEENTIVRMAENEMKTPQAKERLRGLLAQRSEANAKYKSLMEKLGDLGEVLGKKRVQGAGSFADFIEDMTPEKLASRLFSKNNAEALESFTKNFPNEARLLLNYQKSVIRDAAMKDGKLIPSKVFRELDKLSPEVQKLLFTDGERRVMQSARTYLEALPANINPSGTSKAEAYRRFFESPISAAVQTAKDFGAQVALKRLVNRTGGAEAERVHTLIKLESLAQSTSKAIQSGVKSFATHGRGSSVGIAASVNYMTRNRLDEERADRRKKSKQEAFEDRYSEVSNAVANPELMVDQVSKSTAALSGHAPNVASSLSVKATQAAQFLYDKAPKDPVGASGIFPHLRKYQPSDAEISKWERYVTAVDNPLSILKDLRGGMLTREGVEAVQTVYPKIYSEMAQAMVEELSGLKETLPYQKRLQLATFFGNPTDASGAPDFIAYMQGLHATNPENQQSGAGGGMSAARIQNLKFADNRKSDAERLATRA